ncbi:LysE family transporter [Rhizobium sp. VS19-DR104.2]|uniref:LysE family transporter n=1 Tax=unclassified Rhizobium TaxID=2613769 RepID=UPI001C5B49B0|nr:MULTISPECIES: LysE family transporter [unclassified Rhizobium]MBZ5763569.1 LysE family transporter [Rhizobium sp. VS19-DR96]MBZ5769523.1 LysE family transporter [Rhizobium sp. VS19-DR129.2]MBZ5777054.1 LysE family transporter [Rhizobium sp. VS19-DRK62.2]MBZ5788152.1 LysE family transporter [Rhizobium sp. VS19-DR121]MBZ5805607.1 LysE family transporter [Rhizobium sp. VS19-DR181]
MFYFSIAAIWAVAAITPGPNFFVVVRTALEGSRTTALAVIAGVILGTFFWGMAGWLGISALFTAVPFAYALLKVGGGLYLLYLGERLLWQSYANSGQSPTKNSEPAISPRQAFYSGLATNLANPKSAFFVASLFAAALPANYSWQQGMAAVIIMVVISTLWYTFLLTIMRNASVVAAYTRAKRAINVFAAVAFMGFGAKMLASAR